MQCEEKWIFDAFTHWILSQLEKLKEIVGFQRRGWSLNGKESPALLCIIGKYYWVTFLNT